VAAADYEDVEGGLEGGAVRRRDVIHHGRNFNNLGSREKG